MASTKVRDEADLPEYPGPRGTTYVAKDSNRVWISDGDELIELTGASAAAVAALDARIDVLEAEGGGGTAATTSFNNANLSIGTNPDTVQEALDFIGDNFIWSMAESQAITPNMHIVVVDTSGGPVTVELPTVDAYNGLRHRIKRVGLGGCTIDANGNNFDAGAGTKGLGDGEWTDIVYDGGGIWWSFDGVS